MLPPQLLTMMVLVNNNNNNIIIIVIVIIYTSIHLYNLIKAITCSSWLLVSNFLSQLYPFKKFIYHHFFG